MLKRKEKKDTCSGTKKKSKVKMRISSIAKLRMGTSEGKAEIDNFLGNCVNRWFGFQRYC